MELIWLLKCVQVTKIRKITFIYMDVLKFCDLKIHKHVALQYQERFVPLPDLFAIVRKPIYKCTHLYNSQYVGL